MIEQDHNSSQHKSQERVEKSKSPSNEAARDDGNSLNESESGITPSTSLRTSVSQEEFADLRKKDPLVALRKKLLFDT